MTKQSAEAMSAGESWYERWRRFDLFQKSINKPNRVVLDTQEFSREKVLRCFTSVFEGFHMC